MANSTSSNIVCKIFFFQKIKSIFNLDFAKRTRRSNKQHRHRHELSHVIRYPSID